MSGVLEWFPGTLAIVAPHQDDETLACGGLIARLSGQRDIHVVFATDGARSPVPDGGANPALVALREQEAREALKRLGVPPQRLHFLRFPDGRLSEHATQFQEAIQNVLGEIAPVTVLVPFRFDWHPDHIAVHRLTAGAQRQGFVPGVLMEYFVYTRRRLLPGGDVRSCLAPKSLLRVEITEVAAAKREALECFRSQTTRYFEWQRRPILTPQVLERACRSPEFFLPNPETLRTRPWVPRQWIEVTSTWEPRLKRTKDSLVSWLTS